MTRTTIIQPIFECKGCASSEKKWCVKRCGRARGKINEKPLARDLGGIVETKQTYRFRCKSAQGSIVNVMNFLNIPHTI
jgi:hypothetical protein